MSSSVHSDPGQTSSAGPAGPQPASADRSALLLEALRLERSRYQHLSTADFERLCALVVSYHDIFALSEDVIGCVPISKGVYHKVPTAPDLEPLRRRGYSLSMHERLFLKVEIQRLLRLGVIQPSSSPWMSPVVMVAKPNGKLRLTVDFRLINQHTVADPYPLPTVEDVLASMAGSTMWSQIDAVTGFWQIPVDPADVPKCGFTTPFGNFEWVRMPMGMVSAPATYQRLMDTMLGHIEGSRTYVDDTYVFSQGFDAQLGILAQVFAQIREFKLLLQPAKCSFCVQKIVCLGHVLDADGIRPVEDKVAAIVALPLPDSVKALKGLLGMAGVYRKFIEGFANMVEPLEQMTRRGARLEWTAERLAAVEALKQALCSAPVLSMPNWDQPFILTTDWSCAAIGAVLSQRDPVTQDEHPIAFASRALTSAERNYAPTEGECLAAKWAFDKFRYYLHGRKTLLRTDHSALQWLNSARFSNSKLERWALTLQEYDYSVEYVKGETNCVADHLSRACSTVFLGCAYASAKVPSLRRKQRQAMEALVPQYVAGAAWPEHAQRQSELDAVACEVCHHPGGHDNMVLCSGCDRCFHLRCVVPAMSTVPSGDWHCSSCLPVFGSPLDELFDGDTVLQYHQGDPYADNLLLAYIRSGHDESLLASLAQGRLAPLRHKGARFRKHPRVADWLLVNKARATQPERWLTCPPVEYRWDLIRCMHDSLGHAGVKQTTAWLKQSFFWPGLGSDVAMFVRCCDACQRHNLVLPQAPPLQEPEVLGPFEHVHVDLCGPFDAPDIDEKGRICMPEKPQKAHVVIMVDYFTKAAEFAVVFDKTPAAVAKAFYYSWICRYFVPAEVTSDNGTEFQTDFAQLLCKLGVTHIHTSAAHPASNGAAERVVKSFKDMLRAHINAHPVHWLQSVPVIRMQYWSRLHSALGMSPHEMVFGRRPVHAVPLAKLFTAATTVSPVVSMVPEECAAPLLHVQQLQERLWAQDLQVFENIAQQFKRNAAHWPMRLDNRKQRLQGQQLSVGDWVLELVSGPVPSLGEHVRGPYRLVDFCGPGGQLAVLETGGTEFRPSQRFNRHVKNLARYLARHHLRHPAG